VKKFLLLMIPVVLLAFFIGRLTVNTSKSAGHRGPEKVAADPGKKQLYTCGMHPQVIEDHPGDCPICGMKLVPRKSASHPQSARPTEQPPSRSDERKILYWRAPMDPSYVSDKPGKSPMGMDLVPVYEDEVSSGDIQVSPTVIQNIGVTTAEVSKGALSKSIRTYGTATWDETSLAAMNIKVDGWVEKLYVNETGQIVRKGQPLISIYSPQLLATEQEYLSALEAAGSLEKSADPIVASGGRQLLDSARRRLKLWDISDAQINELEKTRKVRKALTLYAPISGIVTDRAVVLGDHVTAGMNLVKIAALNPIWVMASIYENEIPLVKKGIKAVVTFDTLPGETFEGIVDYVYPYVEGKSRTARVRIKLPNPNGQILPQMYASVRLKVLVSTDAVQVPSNAVIRASSTDNVVFIASGGGHFTGRKVILGSEGDNGMVMIKGGVEPGEKVVTSAQFLLDSESNLKAAIQEMISRKNAGAGQ
jgi:RND family efflux transporter MFP subunit